MFFNFFQQNLKSCEVLIYVLFFMSSTKKFLFLAILTWFLILGIIQDDGQEGDHCRWRHRPLLPTVAHKIYLILLRRSKAFHWRPNRFEILQHIKNSGGGGGWVHPTPYPLLPRWGYEFCVYVRGLSILFLNCLKSWSWSSFQHSV